MSELTLGHDDMPHVSYSSFSDWLSCGKKFQLKRLANVPEHPAWWFAGGSAVHKATEDYDWWFLREIGQ